MSFTGSRRCLSARLFYPLGILLPLRSLGRAARTNSLSKPAVEPAQALLYRPPVLGICNNDGRRSEVVERGQRVGAAGRGVYLVEGVRQLFLSKVELTETEWTESRRCCEFVGEMSEPEKEEASMGFEADVWLAMVLLSGSTWSSIWKLYTEALLALALYTQEW